MSENKYMKKIEKIEKKKEKELTMRQIAESTMVWQHRTFLVLQQILLELIKNRD